MPPSTVRDACQGAALQLGWKVQKSSPNEFEFKEAQASMLTSATWSATIKVKISAEGTGATVAVGAKNFGYGPIQSRHVKGLAGSFRNALEVSLRQSSNVAASGTPAPDIASQLQQLSALRTQGALTEDEFVLAKGRLLGGMPDIAAGEVPLSAESDQVIPMVQAPKSKDPFSRR